MANKWRRIAAIAASCVVGATGAVLVSGCGPTKPDYTVKARTGWKDEKVYTNKSYTSGMPSVWNELATKDGSDRELYQYLVGTFFEFDFKFDDNGNIVPGDFEVIKTGATNLEDVTADYVGRYGIPADYTDGHRAWKITLRDDLKWDNGDPITAHDFVYTMEQQLSPKYLFENASNYYSGNYVIHNAREYVYQGQSGWATGNSLYNAYSADLNSKLMFTVGNASENKNFGETVSGIRGLFKTPAEDTAAKFLDDNTSLDASVKTTLLSMQGDSLATIKNDATKREAWEALMANVKASDDEQLYFVVVSYNYADMDFSEVGYLAESDTELVIIMDNTLSPLDANGNLAYQAAYNFGSFPLVKKDMWENLAVKTTTPWTNNYCTGSVENTASWGPYKLTNYQADTTYTLARNENWFGYKMERFDDQYQTDFIEVRKISEWNTAWLAFQQGLYDEISIDTTIANEYRNSERAIFTPSTRVNSLHFQSNAKALKKENGNAMLKYPKFRQALSLALNRAEYASTLTASSLPVLGYLNEMYYYDVENGGVYRNTTFAKEALLETYGATKNGDGKWVVGSTTYDDIDEAVDALSGYNLTLARELVQSAYDEALANGDIDADGTVVLKYGVTEESANVVRVKNFIENSFKEAMKGTSLEGRFRIDFYHFTDATWDTDFRDEGKYDICFGAWMNAPFNPYYMIGAYILDENRFAVGWDAGTETMTMTVTGDNDNPTVTNLTLSIQQWYDALNGSDATYNFSLYPTDTRLQILANLEKHILETYWSIPIYTTYSATLLSYKCEYITREYNTFMGYGGIQYMSYNFDDTEWEEWLKKYDGKPAYNF